MSAHSKGAGFERDVVAVLRAAGHRYAERGYRLGAHDDRGDIDGIPGYAFECRNRKEIALAGWMDEIRGEALTLGVIPVLVVKRRMQPASRAYAVLELSTFAELILEGKDRASGRGEPWQ